MKARNELNARLYRQKTEELAMPRYSFEYAKYTAICNGNTEAVGIQIQDGELALVPDARILSKNHLKNTVYHFVLAASSIADACTEAGMGHDEACALSDLYILKADGCKTMECIHKLYGDLCSKRLVYPIFR